MIANYFNNGELQPSRLSLELSKEIITMELC